MNIVLNEYEWAKEAENASELTDTIYASMRRIAEMHFEDGCKKKEIRKRCEAFLARHTPFPMKGYLKSLTRIMKNLGKTPLLCIPGVHVYKGELETINSIRSDRQKRLAFTMLCLARYNDKRDASNNHWVRDKHKDIMRMANIKVSADEQCALFAALKNAGLISLALKPDDLSMRVEFMCEDKEEMLVTDFRSLGYLYAMQHSDGYFVCANCGIISKERAPSKGRKQKYCKDCAQEVKMQQILDSVYRRKNSA